MPGLKNNFIIMMFRKVSLLTLSHVISGLLMLATTPVLASKLGPELYGEFSFMDSVLFVCIVIGSLGTEYIGNREVACGKNREESVNAILLLRSAASIIVYILLTIWIFLFIDSKTLRPLLFVCSTIVLSVPGIAGWFFLAQHKIKLVAAVTILRELSFFVFVVFFLGKIGSQDNQALQAGIFYSISRFIFAGALFFRLIRDHKFSFKVKYETYYKIIKDSAPLLYATLIIGLVINIETFILKYYDRIYSLGIYGAFFKQIFYLQLLPLSFTAIFFPVLSRAWRENRPGYERVAKLLSEIILLIMVPISLAGVLNADYLIKSFFSAEYENGTSAMRLLCLCLVPMGFQRVLTTCFLITMDKSSKMYAITNITFIFSIIAGFLLIGNFQRAETGAALSKLLTETLALCISLRIISANIKVVDPQMLYSLIPAVSGMVSVHLVLFTASPVLKILLGPAMFFIIYSFITYKTRYPALMELKVRQE